MPYSELARSRLPPTSEDRWRSPLPAAPTPARGAAAALEEIAAGGGLADEVRALRERLREREEEVIRAVSLGQTIVDDLRAAKREAERYKALAEDAAGHESFLRRAEELLKVTEAAMEERVVVTADAAAAVWRKQRRNTQTTAHATEAMLRDRERDVREEDLVCKLRAAEAARDKLRAELRAERQGRERAEETLRRVSTESIELRQRAEGLDAELHSARRTAQAARNSRVPMQQTLQQAKQERDRLAARSNALQARATAGEQTAVVLKEREAALRQQVAAHLAAQRKAEAALVVTEREHEVSLAQLREEQRMSHMLRVRLRDAETYRDAGANRDADAAALAASADADARLRESTRRADRAEAALAAAREEAEELREQLVGRREERFRVQEEAASTEVDLRLELERARARAARAEREAETHTGEAARERSRADSLTREYAALNEQLAGCRRDNAALREEVTQGPAGVLADLRSMAEQIAETGAILAEGAEGSVVPGPKAFPTADTSLTQAVRRVVALTAPLPDLARRFSVKSAPAPHAPAVDTVAAPSSPGFWGHFTAAHLSPQRPARGLPPPRATDSEDSREHALRELRRELDAARGDVERLTAGGLHCPHVGCSFRCRREANLAVHLRTCLAAPDRGVRTVTPSGSLGTRSSVPAGGSAPPTPRFGTSDEGD
eukprot:Hpha_TRINITY_DN27335_c0_g1::TRINITY_DN27335_c0_g1_i1::g.527::m.527